MLSTAMTSTFQVCQVQLLGYPQKIGSAQISMVSTNSIVGNLSVEFGDITAELKFEKTLKFEKISGFVEYLGERHAITIEGLDMIFCGAYITVAGFLIKNSSAEKINCGIYNQSFHQNTQMVLKSILKKESDIEKIVDMVIFYLKTGVYQLQK